MTIWMSKWKCTHPCHGPAGCPDRPPDVPVCWAHGLLCVVGAMGTPVYCLSSPILLPGYCFSCSTCVSLITRYLNSWSVVLFWYVVVCRLCLHVTLLSLAVPLLPCAAGLIARDPAACVVRRHCRPDLESPRPGRIYILFMLFYVFWRE